MFNTATLLITAHPTRLEIATTLNLNPPQHTSPASSDTRTPGDYRLTLTGSLKWKSQQAPVQFQVGPVTVRRVAAGFLSLNDVAAAALAEIRRRFSGQGHWGRSIVEDADRHRIVRIYGPSPSMWSTRLYVVRLSPSGKPAWIGGTEFGCIARGTPIATPGGPVPIEQLQPGDTVWSYDAASRRRVVARVEALRPAGTVRPLLLRGVRLTGNHPVWHDGRWVPARRLTTARAATASPVYDLSVGPPHNYFAGPLLVHNKTRGLVASPR